MSEVLAAAAIGLGGGIATFVAIQQVRALIIERGFLPRATARTVSRRELERAVREAEWRFRQERPTTK